MPKTVIVVVPEGRRGGSRQPTTPLKARTSAEACYTALGTAGEGLARQIFLRLTTPGEGTGDTRRRTPLGEVHALGERADAVVRAFGNARLLTFDHDSLSRAPTVEVAHEALLRAWPRLRGWLDGARADVGLCAT